MLLAGHLDDRILALQSQGIFTDPQSYITYATALAYRGEKARLQHYLIENTPLFTTDAQEKSWLYLLSKYSANPVQALANYTVQFADNHQYVVGATLPVLLKKVSTTQRKNCSPPSPPMKCLRSVIPLA